MSDKRTKVFRDYDQAELDRQYDQRAWAPNAIEVINRYTADSEAVRRRLGDPEAHPYGEDRAETLDLFRAHRPHAPIHVFIHGGAWRTLGKRDSAFAAETFVRAGAHFVALDFALLPVATLDEMVGQVRSAIAWIYRNADRLGGDPKRIFVSGHSSGAHLAGTVITADWPAQFGLPPDVVAGALCISGIYDLEPVRRSARNAHVQLDAAMVDELSPGRHAHHIACPVVVATGEYESDELKRQARDFAGLIERRGGPVRLVEGAGCNHFEIINTLASPFGLLGRIALQQMGLGLG
ncbi:MAG TPA: alpha/beta hydrolase [Xanthobacteraceae bacterium]|jgi:arylformamidase|nr:alpha/beta hydrolase [Xanthobacteraceae bacterium]